MAAGGKTRPSEGRKRAQSIFHRPRPTGLRATVRQVSAPQEVFEPLPAPTGNPPFRMDLATILGADAAKAIAASGSMTFHVAGDTGGIKLPLPQQHVADAMEADFSGPDKPAFFYHLGDVVYFFGQASEYFPQFYEPYMHYPAPIVGIPGNHDGGVADPSETSLGAFVQNFCAASPSTPPNAGDAPRTTMIQPNVYWTFLTPFATFVGLYSNVPQGGVIKQDQADWLAGELKAAPSDKALIVSLHHPPFSADQYHAGSLSMVEVLDNAFTQSGRTADLVFAGHVHNYQRFTRAMGTRQIPYIVAGAGGYHNLHTMQKDAGGNSLAVPYGMPNDPGLTLENYCDSMYGYLLVKASASTIHGEYLAVPPATTPNPVPAQMIDVFDLDIARHKLASSRVVPVPGVPIG